MATRKKIITLNELKRSNLQAILSLLIQRDGFSRVEIAKHLNCDNTTITRAIKELIEMKLVCVGEKNELKRGRPRMLLRINQEGPLLVGISFEVNQIIGILTDLHSVIIQKAQIIFDRKPTKQTFLSAVKRIITQLIQSAGNRLAGIGVSAFGSYSGDDFTIRNAAALAELNGVALKPFLEKIAGRPVFICDHMISKMYYLTRFYNELNQGTVMLLSAGAGIGNVIIDHGKPMFCRGNHGGEFGHSIYVLDGKKCSCGRNGCLETIISTDALLREYRKIRNKPRAALQDLFNDFRKGDVQTVCLVGEAAEIFGTAITNQLNNYPVDTLVITGTILSFGEEFCNFLRQHILAKAFQIVLDHLQIRFIPIEDEDSLARGVTIQLAENFAANISTQSHSPEKTES